MRLSFQIALVVLIGMGALYVGIHNMYSPLSVIENFYSVNIDEFNAEARLAIESQIRLLSGIWLAAGMAVLLAVRRFEMHTPALRLVLLGLSLGAIGELATVASLDGNLQPAAVKAAMQVTICIAMELWRSRLVKANRPDNTGDRMEPNESIGAR